MKKLIIVLALITASLCVNVFATDLEYTALYVGSNKAFLLSTGDEILVEASPYDKVWGIGMYENNVNATNPALWKGENMLGFALMEARDIIRENDKRGE